MDVSDEKSAVPSYQGDIFMKVSRLLGPRSVAPDVHSQPPIVSESNIPVTSCSLNPTKPPKPSRQDSASDKTLLKFDSDDATSRTDDAATRTAPSPLIASTTGTAAVNAAATQPGNFIPASLLVFMKYLQSVLGNVWPSTYLCCVGI